MDVIAYFIGGPLDLTKRVLHATSYEYLHHEPDRTPVTPPAPGSFNRTPRITQHRYLARTLHGYHDQNKREAALFVYDGAMRI